MNFFLLVDHSVKISSSSEFICPPVQPSEISPITISFTTPEISSPLGAGHTLDAPLQGRHFPTNAPLFNKEMNPHSSIFRPPPLFTATASVLSSIPAASGHVGVKPSRSGILMSRRFHLRWPRLHWCSLATGISDLRFPVIKP